MASQYVPTVPDPGKRDSICAHVTVTQWFICINESDESSYWFLIGHLFYDITTKRQGRRHDIPKQASLLSWSQHQPPADSEESVLLTCLRAENGTALSLVTASVGFTVEGFPPSSLLLAELSMKILRAEDLYLICLISLQPWTVLLVKNRKLNRLNIVMHIKCWVKCEAM